MGNRDVSKDHVLLVHTTSNQKVMHIPPTQAPLCAILGWASARSHCCPFRLVAWTAKASRSPCTCPQKLSRAGTLACLLHHCCSTASTSPSGAQCLPLAWRSSARNTSALRVWASPGILLSICSVQGSLVLIRGPTKSQSSPDEKGPVIMPPGHQAEVGLRPKVGSALRTCIEVGRGPRCSCCWSVAVLCGA